MLLPIYFNLKKKEREANLALFTTSIDTYR